MQTLLETAYNLAKLFLPHIGIESASRALFLLRIHYLQLCLQAVRDTQAVVEPVFGQSFLQAHKKTRNFSRFDSQECTGSFEALKPR